MTGGSYYDTLGLPPDATPAEIREAFVRLQQAHRPGRRASYAQRLEAGETMAVLMAAYQALTDPKRRAEQDWRLGIDDLQPLDWGGAMPEPHPIDARAALPPALPRRPPLTPREWRGAFRLLRRRICRPGG